jgi:hypothetical protein
MLPLPESDSNKICPCANTVNRRRMETAEMTCRNMSYLLTKLVTKLVAGCRTPDVPYPLSILSKENIQIKID